MAKSSTVVALLAARDAETGLAGIVSLIEGGERVDCASADLGFLLRGILHDVAGCREELESFNEELEKRGKLQ